MTISKGPPIYFACGKCGEKHLAIFGANIKKGPNGSFISICTRDL